MKKLFILYTLLTACMMYSQNSQFEITDQGLLKYVVTNVTGVSKDEAYKKTIEWINRNFNSPENVFKGDIKNEYIRIEAISETAVRYPVIGGTIYRPIQFQIEISFKDDKYKFEILSIKEKNLEFPSISNIPFKTTDFSKEGNSKGYSSVRKSNGEFRNWYKYVNDIPVYFNSLNISLKEYILEKNKNDNW